MKKFEGRMKPQKPYRSEKGHWLSTILFYETHADRYNDKWQPVFTLNKDHPGLINARKTFVELCDPTGYKWAMLYLGDYAHWLHLLKQQFFRDAYETWMDELNMKLKSEAIARLQEIAKSDTAQATVANKYLASREYDKAERGRPSKSEITGELKRAVQMSEMERDDLERIGGLKVINGGKHVGSGTKGS